MLEFIHEALFLLNSQRSFLVETRLFLILKDFVRF